MLSDSFVKCRGEGCLLAFRCRRFTAYIADNSPPFFADAPYKIVDDTLKCILFWGDIESSEQLNETTDGENNAGGTKEDAVGGAKEIKQGVGKEFKGGG